MVKKAALFFRRMRNSPFRHGWTMIACSLLVPALYSSAIDLTSSLSNIEDLGRLTKFRADPDFSFLIDYFVIVIFHLALSVVITAYCYRIFKDTSSNHLFLLFKKSHLASFFAASTLFTVAVYFSDTSMKILSYDLIWEGLRKVADGRWMFLPIFTPAQCEPGFPIFFLVPLVSTLAAFLPASAIMQLIPHLVERIDLDSEVEIEQKIAGFIEEFEVVYYMLVALFMSSSVATLLYLRLPFVAVERKASEHFSNLTDSAFVAWSMAFFLVLSGILIYSYNLVTKRLRARSEDDLIVNPNRYQAVRVLVTLHFMIRKKTTVLLSSFTPIIALAVKHIIA